MRAQAIAALLLGTLVTVAAAQSSQPDQELLGNWPQWRGPLGTGEAPGGDVPVEWSESKNIRWKIEIPGTGHATPVVWGERIFVLTAVPIEDETDRGGQAAYAFTVLAIDRNNGKVLWRKIVSQETPHEGIHKDSTQASTSPVTDDKRLYAYFGSRGLHCLDHKDGKILWQRDFGDLYIRMKFGEGSSPALSGNTLVIVWDHEGEDFIVALDKKTGKERWRVPRDEHTAWATPLIVDVKGRQQVVTSATGRIRGYSLDRGKLLWECGGMTANVIPSPLVADDLVYLASGFRGNALLAVRIAEARGDITDGKAIAWSYDRHTPYTPSLLAYEGSLYMLESNKGLLSNLDAATGEERYTKEKLSGLRTVYASPVAASGRIYITSTNGKTCVVRHGKEFELLATNELDDGFSASPVIIGDALYLRGHRNLYCIGLTADDEQKDGEDEGDSQEGK